MTRKEESIQNILEMAEYKKQGKIRALIVTGCLAQRYRQEIIDEIPEVDEVLGTTAYDKILDAVDAALAGGTFCHALGSGCPAPARYKTACDYRRTFRVSEDRGRV